MKKRMGLIIGGIAAVIILVFVAVFAVSTLRGGTGEGKYVSHEEAEIMLDNKLSKLSKSIIDSELRSSLGGAKDAELSLAEELPDISEYPLMVQGNTPIVLEIASSTEKSGTDTDGALNEVAEKFNQQQLEVNGQKVSVSIRSIASGEAIDYIVSGKYVPDAYTPSNELWGEMLKSKGVKVDLKESRLAGNTAGLVMEKNQKKEFEEKYGEVTLESVVEAIVAGDLSFGYTNPYASSTGLNFITSLLYSKDPSNPLSDTAVQGFVDFQKNVKHLSFTTIQLRNSVQKGSIKAFVYEYQNYVNTKELSGYEFTSFGVRHDNPIYAVEDLSQDKEEALDLFIEYCLGDSAQEIFSKRGFNKSEIESYTAPDYDIDGASIIAAQNLWKEEKNVRPLAAVFVADTSGSMVGEPLNQLQTSLLNAIEYIGDEHAIGLVTYNTKVYRDVPIGTFDETHKGYFRGAVEYMTASGGTATNDAILVAIDMLRQYEEENPGIRTMIIVLSDGMQTDGYSLKEVRDIIQGMQIPIHTIGYNAVIENLEEISNINEAATINATSDNVVYKLKTFFNAEL